MDKVRTTFIFIALLFLIPCIAYTNEVYTIRIQGAINPPMASFVMSQLPLQRRMVSGPPYPLGHAWRA